MTNQTPTPEQLQVMYNNFVKISQWLTKKDQAPSPLPPLYADIISELKALRDKVADLEFKQSANLEEIHYLQGLIERNKTSATLGVAEPEPSQAEPEPVKKSRKKKQAEQSETQPSEEPPSEGEALSAPILTPAPAPSQEQPPSAEELSQAETEPLDIELDSTVFTSVSEEVSKILDEINKRSEE